MEDGTKLVFGTANAVEITNSTLSQSVNSELASFISAWYLKTITSPTGEVITFNYETSTINQDASYYEATYMLQSAQQSTCATNSFNKPSYKHFETQGVTMLNLQSIQSDIGKIVFINDTTGRIDLKGGKVIKEMDVYSYLNNNQLIHKFTFTHGYSTAVTSNGYTNVNSAQSQYRLKLNSIQEVPIDGISPKVWTFTYNPLVLPSRQSFAQDHWGYYNGAINNTTLLPPIIGFSNTANYTSGVRDADSASMAAEMLTKITYPTGGFTKFNFEPNVIATTKDYQTNGSANINLSLTQNTSPYVSTASQTFAITQQQSVNLSFTATNSSNAISDFGPSTVVDTVKLVMISGTSRTVIKQYNITASMLSSGRYALTQGVTLYGAGTYILTISTIVPQSNLTSNGYVNIIGGINYQMSSGVKPYNQIVGGLRIKSMIDSAGTSSIPIQRNFTYQSPGVVPFDPVNSYLSTNTDNIYDCAGICTPSSEGTPVPDGNNDGGYFVPVCYDYSRPVYDIYNNFVGNLTSQICTTIFLPPRKTYQKPPGNTVYYASAKMDDNESERNDLKYTSFYGHDDDSVENTEVQYNTDLDGGIPGTLMTSFTYLTRSSSVRCNLGSIQGGTVGYGKVTTSFGAISQSNPNGTNGYSISYFSQANDLNIASSQSFPYPPTVPIDWEQGLLLNEITYDVNNHPLKKTTNTFNFVNQQSIKTFRTAPSFNTANICYDVSVLGNYITRIYYQILTEKVQKTATTNVNYYNNGADSVATTTRFYYDSLQVNYQPLKTQTTNSRGEVIKVVNNTALELSAINASVGPLSAAATTAIDTMLNRNMVSHVIETETYNNNVLVSKALTNYALFNNHVLPQEIKTVDGSNPIQSRILFNAYDNYGNLLEQQKTGGPLNDYIWDYNSNYVIAAVTGGSQPNIAYTGFESKGTGNWTIGSPARDSITVAYWGTKTYNLASPSGAITKSGLNAGTTYVVSLWTNNTSSSAITITGTIGGYPVKGPTVNGWTYYKYEVTGQTAINLSGTGNIDELKLYPVGALMTTYTYNPLVGLTSMTDAKGETIFYQYDGLQRLSSIKDQYGYIIKSYCYNYAGQPYGCPVPQGTPVQPIASVSNSSFVTSNLMDNEWKQQVPTTGGYTIAPDDGTTINPAGNAGSNAGRFAYFSTGGSLATPITYVNGTLSFTAKGSGTIEIQLIASWNNNIVARKTFALTADFQNYSWQLTNLYPQLEMMVAVMVNGGNSSPQASVQFQNNFSLNLAQCGLTGVYQRFRADPTSLIGNSETAWYGWSNNSGSAVKKYLQHSAYSRMRFQTSATQMVIEYVRDFYDRLVVNLFPLLQTQNNSVFNSTGNVVTGTGAVNISTQVKGGQVYTISGLMATSPTCVWFQGGAALGPPQALTNIGTVAAPVYQVTAPNGATNLGLLVQNTNDNYTVYNYCMVQQGAVGTATPNNGNIPSAYVPFSGNTPSLISGPAVFINGSLYKYYQVQGTDQATVVQFVADNLPAGNKTVEVMMPGQSPYPYTALAPPPRMGGTFLRAVYFPGSSTTVYPSSTVVSGSIAYIHDSILSGYNITSDAQDSVWMMMVKRNPAYGFTGDVFSEGYGGRLLYTDINTPALTTAFARKLASFGVDKYWFQIGVNDYSLTTPLAKFYTQYKSLVEQLKALRPNAKIYIQSTGPEYYEGPNSETVSDNGLAATGPAANDFRDVQRAIATSHSYCQYVNFEGLFPAVPGNLADGLHPTNTGNVLYANGIQSKSDLLGTILPATPLTFYRSTSRPLIRNVPGIYTITATGGTAPYTFSLVSGTLPSGLTFNPDGTITGTPTASGTFSLAVRINDSNSGSVTQTVSMTVNPVPTIVVAPSAASIVGTAPGTIYVINNTPASITFTGAQGYGPYTLSSLSGSLPSGMTYNAATGVLSGTPEATVGTNYTFTLSATDHWGFSGSTTFTLEVLSSPPLPPTDNFTVTAAVSSTNHLLVTGHLNNSYNTALLSFIAAYYTPSGSTSQVLLSGGYVGVNAGANTGTAVDMGPMALLPGSFTVSLADGGIYPTQIGNTTISYNPATTNATLNTAYTSPTEQLTATASYAAGTISVAAQLPNAPLEPVLVAAAAIITQNGTSVFVSTPMITIGTGSLASTPVSISLPSSIVSGTFTVQLYIGAVSPGADNGKFIGFTNFDNNAPILTFTK